MSWYDSLIGGSKSKSSSSSQSSTRPWEFQAPYLAQGYGTAQSLFEQGGPQYYPGQTVGGFSPVTDTGIGMGVTQAMQQNPMLHQGQDYLSGVLQGNFTPDASTGFAGLNSLAGGNNAMMNDPNGYMLNAGAYSASAPSNMLDKVNYGNVGDVSVGNDHLDSVQQGNYLGSNPYLSSAVQGATSRVTDDFNNSVLPGLNATFGSGGRTGSGIHEQSLNNAGQNLAQTVGDMSNNMYSNAYQFERGQQDAAATNLMDADLAAKLGNQSTKFGAESANANLSATGLNAATNAGIASMNAQLGAGQGNQGFYGGMAQGNQNAWGQGLNNMLNASTGLTGNYFSGLNNMNNAASMIPTMQGANYFDADRMLGYGSMIDDKAQQFIDSDVGRFNYNQQQPYRMLDWYMNAIGAPVMTSDSSSVSKSSSRQKNGMGEMLGAAAGAMMMSDIRLKDNIAQISSMNGIPVYRWDWNESARVFGLEGDDVGFIAQEIEQIYPHAIAEIGGYKAINYSEVIRRAA